MTGTNVRVDYGNMLAGVLAGGGTNPERLAADGDLAHRFDKAFREVEDRRESGEMGFFALPFDREAEARACEAARSASGCDALVVIGIGGSALGTKALRGALLPPFWNELDAAERSGPQRRRGGPWTTPRLSEPTLGPRPRLYVLDNPDPATASALLGRLDLRRTALNVVSKSGSTAETMANFMVVWDRLKQAAGQDAAQRLVVTTGRAGPLRRLAESLGATCLPIPENVGGRFSALSAVGLLPAVAVGIDAAALLDGAADMVRRCEVPSLRENPAGMVATLLHAADAEAGAGIHVFMPYADRLRWLAAWFQQLWAESLGKARDRTGATVETGPTPLPALGANDQHSLLQLLMEGPRDKAVVFVACRDPGEDLPVPQLFGDEPDVSHSSASTLFQLLDCEQRATADALRRAGRMNMTVTLDQVDARSLGALIMLFQIAVVYAGALYGVDPLNQPGVELGKKLARELIGRPAEARSRIPPPDPRWQV